MTILTLAHWQSFHKLEIQPFLVQLFLYVSSNTMPHIYTEPQMLYHSQIIILRPNYGGVVFFFSRPAAGLTNRDTVRHSIPGVPLLSIALVSLSESKLGGTSLQM
jgi:hypothetical protein